MAPKIIASELPLIFKLQFIDTNFGRELLADKNLKTYNDVYYEVENVESLFAGEEVSEDDATYKEDLLSLKVAGLHKIAAKPEVFPCKDLFARAVANCTLEQGILGSPVGTVAVISGSVFWDLYKMPQPDMVYNADVAKAFLKGKFDTDHVNQYWVPLLGEIIMNDRRPDLSKLLAFNLHTNWEIVRSGNDFFMASYVMDASIIETDMPRVSEVARKDLSLIGAWWYFEDATIIRVEGTLIPPIALPPYVPDRLIALEVARQCNYGVARRCKMVNQRPYPYLPFKIGDFYFESCLALEKFAREVETMNLRAKGVMRCWDPYGEVEAEDTDEVIKHKLLRGLPTGPLEVQLPLTIVADTVSSLAFPTTVAFNSSVADPLSIGPNVAPSVATPSISKVPPPGSMFSPSTPPLSSLTTPLFPVLISPIPSSSTTLVPVLSTTFPFTSSSQSTPLTTEVVATISFASLPLPSLSTSSPLPFTTIVFGGEEVHRSLEMETTFPLDLSAGIRVSPFVLLKPSLWGSPMFILPTPPMSLASPLTISQSALDTSVATSVSTLAFTPPTTTFPWEYRLRTSLSASEASTTLGFPDPVSTTEEHPEVTLEFNKATNSLKKVTKRRIKTGESVTILQIEENLMSLTRKRKRGTKGAGMDYMELVVDLVSIVRSTNKMSKEVVERMQMELSQGHDKIVVSPSAIEIQGALKDLFKSFVQVEEAKATGNQVHHIIQS
eukprot:Gb_33091 [translate_table: standard]